MARIAKSISAGCAMALLVTSGAAYADKASSLTHINGMYAGEAERALRDRGFSHESSHDSYSNGYTYSYWWDKRDDDCVRVEAYGGKVMTVVDGKDGDCGHGGGSGAAVAAVAGAAIIGALIASKSHHRDNDDDHRGENRREFDRGYNDGLYHHSYHNNGRSDSYARGYSAGVNERNGRGTRHSNRGGYHSAVRFSDLKGDRAAGAMSNISSRGFTQVDNFTSGNTRYSIQWNRDTRQCVQMTIADGRVSDIRDIHTHPKCR